MKAQSPNHSTARELQVGLLMLVKSSHLSSVVKVCGQQVQLLLQPLLGDAGLQPPDDHLGRRHWFVSLDPL